MSPLLLLQRAIFALWLLWYLSWSYQTPQKSPFPVMQLAFSFQKKQVDKQALSLLKSSLWWELCIISSTSFRTSIMTQFHHTGLHFPCPDNVCLWCSSFPQKLRGVAVVELGTSIAAAWLGLRWASGPQQGCGEDWGSTCSSGFPARTLLVICDINGDFSVVSMETAMSSLIATFLGGLVRACGLSLQLGGAALAQCSKLRSLTSDSCVGTFVLFSN